MVRSSRLAGTASFQAWLELHFKNTSSGAQSALGTAVLECPIASAVVAGIT